LSPKQASDRYGVPERTIREWCKNGKVAAMAKPFGKKTTYQITPQAIESLLLSLESAKQEKASSKTLLLNHQDLIPKWEKSMKLGVLTGKAFSPRTIKTYSYYTKAFFEKQESLTVDSLKNALMKIPPNHFAKRLKVYESLVCFGRFLSTESILPGCFIEEVKCLRPKRHLPPKRQTVREDDLQKLYDGCQSPQDVALVTLLSSTGLRASEACALVVADIDFQDGVLTVQCGKGGKRRQVGLSASAMASLNKLIEDRKDKTSQAHLFLNKDGKPMSRHGLFQRLERIGKAVGVTVTPHALRRAFVTINANKGRPLQMLQRACGHSDIKTTMSYCRTSEQEVIDAMKSW
jgi:integrase/recombinase XerD